jgi:hypothetical protein
VDDLIERLRYWNPVAFPLVAQAADELDRLRRELAEARELLQSTRNMWAAVSQDAFFAHSKSRGHVCDYVRSLQSCKDRACEEVARIDAAMESPAPSLPDR